MAAPAVAAPVDAPDLIIYVDLLDPASVFEVRHLRMHSKLVVVVEGNEGLTAVRVVAVALVHDDPSQLRSTIRRG
jgi:hypothetical protein